MDREPIIQEEIIKFISKEKECDKSSFDPFEMFSKLDKSLISVSVIPRNN